MDDMTQEEIDRQYAAAMDSVNLINGNKPAGVTDDEWSERVRRNIRHLEFIVTRDYWGDRDLTPLHDAITNPPDGPIALPN